MRAIELHWDEEELPISDDGFLTPALARAILGMQVCPRLWWNYRGAVYQVPMELLRNAVEIRDDYLSRNADRPHDLMHKAIGIIRLDQIGKPLTSWQSIKPK